MNIRLQSFAKSLRNGMTDAEQKLWVHLRAHRLVGFKFKRQQPLGPYIADFVCLRARLIVEVDGSQHLENVRDAKRDEWFAANGFRVLRFWNNQVLQETEAVLEEILRTVEETPLPQPLSREGRGEQPRATNSLSPARGEGLESSASYSPLPSRERGWGRGGNKP
jgi:very-short-patch-repair endonuclease